MQFSIAIIIKKSIQIDCVYLSNTIAINVFFFQFWGMFFFIILFATLQFVNTSIFLLLKIRIVESILKV